MPRMPERHRHGRAAGRIAFIAALLAATAAVAGEAPARPDAACAAMGAGFRRVPGSDTCVQISGSADVTVGRGAAASNAPNQGLQNTPSAGATTATPDPWQRTR
ncbi:hypothetical protein [Azorhizobium doebereinerae]|uniref:hypothetical protein n=1 Tax=Azorhizobium doebereinerae TaxID=281091 RepID=UPI0003F8DAE8|nr:hypothetical protein [Azorhizobium doebereinerae]